MLPYHVLIVFYTGIVKKGKFKKKETMKASDAISIYENLVQGFT